MDLGTNLWNKMENPWIYPIHRFAVTQPMLGRHLQYSRRGLWLSFQSTQKRYKSMVPGFIVRNLNRGINDGVKNYPHINLGMKRCVSGKRQLVVFVCWLSSAPAALGMRIQSVFEGLRTAFIIVKGVPDSRSLGITTLREIRDSSIGIVAFICWICYNEEMRTSESNSRLWRQKMML